MPKTTITELHHKIDSDRGYTVKVVYSCGHSELLNGHTCTRKLGGEHSCPEGCIGEPSPMMALSAAIEEAADDMFMMPSMDIDDFRYPIVVNNVVLGSIEIEEPIHGGIGGYVSIRPCDPTCDGKTYLGILLGDFPVSSVARYRPKTGELTLAAKTNPAIFVPDLGRVVFGYESWWGPIKGPDHLRRITNDDISSVWYVQALKSMEKEEGDDKETDKRDEGVE